MNSLIDQLPATRLFRVRPPFFVVANPAAVSITVTAATTGAPANLQYPTPPTFVVNTKITLLTPTVVGTVKSYSVSPALPAGLSLSTTTGVISGTPTSVAVKANYTVKASNAAGSTTANSSVSRKRPRLWERAFKLIDRAPT